MASTHAQEPAVTELLALAISEPQRASGAAAELIRRASDPWVLSIAHQTLGIVLRDRGDLEPAVQELRLAVRLARRSRDPDRGADARATLGVALVMAGRT